MFPSVEDRHTDTEKAWQKATGVQDTGMPIVGSSQIIFPLPNSKHTHSWPQPSCTSLPGSHDELVPRGIQSELGEILGSRIGEVRDPGLQVWGRERQTFGYCWTRGSQLYQHGAREFQARGARRHVSNQLAA